MFGLDQFIRETYTTVDHQRALFQILTVSGHGGLKPEGSFFIALVCPQLHRWDWQRGQAGFSASFGHRSSWQTFLLCDLSQQTILSVRGYQLHN